MQTGRNVTLAVIVGIALVFGLAGWRWFNGEAEKAQVMRPAAPIVKAVASTVAAPPPPAEAPALLNQLEYTQQNLVDDLQFTQNRVAKQDAEIRRLRAELEALSQRYDTLKSFASTKEAKAEPAVQPPKKKKKRYYARRSVKKKPTA